MKLSKEQIGHFERDGYLVLPDLFSAEEIAVLTRELPRVFALERAEVPRSGIGEPRLAHRLERYSEPFARLLRHPRMVEPARQLIGGPVYSHQYKVVTKAPFGQLNFPWHQDYATWAAVDGMPRGIAINFALFLDEVTEFNGPITLIPGSHRDGVLDAPVVPLDGSSDFAALEAGTVERLVAQGGLMAPKGPAGTGLFFHGCTAHDSAPNISPWPRNNVYSSLNHVENGIRHRARPEFYAAFEVEELVPLADDCLLLPIYTNLQ